MQGLKSFKKSVMKALKRRAVICIIAAKIACVFGLFVSPWVLAVPNNLTIEHGQANISADAQTLSVVQKSQALILNTPQFNLAHGEAAHFIQPDGAAALLRIHDHAPSFIDGQLSATGLLFMLNQHGIVFGENAVMNVNQLMASTGLMRSEDFLSQYYYVSQMDQSASVINYGQVNADRGSVFFIAQNIENHGAVEANQSNIAWHAAGDVLIHTEHNQLIGVQVNKAALAPHIVNTGEVYNHAGRTVINASTAPSSLQQSLQTAVNNQGLIQANSLNQEAGVIHIAANHAVIENSGVLQAGAGEIRLEAAVIAQRGIVDASAKSEAQQQHLQNGGAVALYAEQSILLDTNSRISSDGALYGDGGEVIVFSPSTALFMQGSVISAQGGNLAGDGGFIEVSAWQNLWLNGLANTTAAMGEQGAFYIDPYDITVSDNPALLGSFDSADPNSWQASAVGSNVNVASLEANLGLSDVIIQTMGPGGDNGDIYINSDINLDGRGDHSLSFLAEGSIFIHANLSDANTATSEAGALFFTAGGNVSMQDNVVLEAGLGEINIDAGGNAEVSGLISLNTQADAVRIAAGASILSAGDNFIDIQATGGIDFSSNVGVGETATALRLSSAEITINSINANSEYYITNDKNTVINSIAPHRVFAFETSGELQFSQAAITSHQFDVKAAAWQDADKRIDLQADTIDLELFTQAYDLTLNTQASNMSVNISNANQFFHINNSGDLNLTAFQTNGHVQVSAAQLILPDAAITGAQRLSFNVDDVFDSDRVLALSANAVDIRLNQAHQPITINAQLSLFDARSVGGNITLNNSLPLSFTDLTASGYAIEFLDGNFILNNQASVVIEHNMSVSDISDDNVRAGLLGISYNGDLTLNSTGQMLSIESLNAVDQNELSTLSNSFSLQTAILFMQNNTDDSAYRFTHMGSFGLDVNTQGGDVVIDHLGAANLTRPNERVVSLSNQTLLQAYNSVLDASDGVVSADDADVNGALLVAKSGRGVYVNALKWPEPDVTPPDVTPPDLEPELPSLPDSITDDAQQIETPVYSDDVARNPNNFAAMQGYYFNDCLAIEDKLQNRDCEQQQAIKQFLNSLLIGGKLPRRFDDAR